MPYYNVVDESIFSFLPKATFAASYRGFYKPLFHLKQIFQKNKNDKIYKSALIEATSSFTET